jgi:hypothetical protein
VKKAKNSSKQDPQYVITAKGTVAPSLQIEASIRAYQLCINHCLRSLFEEINLVWVNKRP